MNTIRSDLDIDMMIEMYKSGLSCCAIAKNMNSSPTTVTRRFDECGFNKVERREARDIGKKYKNKKWLEEQYYTSEMSQQQIADKCGVGQDVIHKTMKGFGMKARSISLGRHIRMGNNFHVTREAIDFLDGCLLGDGHISATSIYAASYSHADKHKRYIEWMVDKFSEYDIYTGSIKKRIDNNLRFKKPAISYSYSSLSYPELLELQKKWYISRIKHIPKDLKLPNNTCLMWFIGDGSLVHRPSGSIHIRLHTCGFEYSEVMALIEEVASIGIIGTYIQSSNSIYLSHDNAMKFLDYIGPCPKEIWNCYGYKWDLTRSKKEWEAEYAV